MADQEFTQVEDAPVEQPVTNEVAAEPAVSDDAGDTVPTSTEPVAEKKQDPWKTAFIVLIGIVMLSAVLIYSTSSRRTEPTTVLQTDANGQPVQPLNPATGVEEERLPPCRLIPWRQTLTCRPHRDSFRAATVLIRGQTAANRQPVLL